MKWCSQCPAWCWGQLYMLLHLGGDAGKCEIGTGGSAMGWGWGQGASNLGSPALLWPFTQQHPASSPFHPRNEGALQRPTALAFGQILASSRCILPSFEEPHYSPVSYWSSQDYHLGLRICFLKSGCFSLKLFQSISPSRG